MANIFDDLPTNPYQLEGTDYSFYDADTLYDKEGIGYRLQGVNALEVDTLGKEGDIGGKLTTEQAVRLANDLGFTDVVKLGEKDADGKREMVDLRNRAGQSFSRELAASGLADGMNEYDAAGYYARARYIRDAAKSIEGYEENDFDKAAQLLEDHLEAENANTLRFKQKRIMPGQQGEWFTNTGAMFARPGVVSETGKSTSQWGGTAWDTTMHGVAESAYGTASIIAEKLGFEKGKDWAEAGVYGQRAKIKDYGTILTDYKDINGFTDAAKYISNLAVMSLPYMGITAGGVALSGVTGGASMLAPVSVYTGQVWNEMGDQSGREKGDRSAGIAIAAGVMQAALDTLGLKGLSGGSKELFAQGVSALVAKGATREAAEATIMNASKREMANLLGDVGKVARDQLAAKQLTMDTMKAMARGAGFEGATEAAQEGIAAIAADIGSGQVIDWTDVSDRMIQGAVGGGALGGAFSAAGRIKDAGEWANLAWGQEFDPAGVSNSAKFAEEEQVKKGYVPTIQEETAQLKQDPEGTFSNLEERTERHKNNKRNRTTSETIFDTLMAAPKLWRGAVRYAIPLEVQEQSRAARVLADMFGGNLERIFGGSNYESYKHHLVSTYRNMVSKPEDIFSALDGKPLGRDWSGAERARVSQEFYKEALEYAKNNDISKLTGTQAQIDAKLKLIKELETLANKMYKDQSKYNKNLNKLSNYLLRYRALDKGAVNKDRSGFIDKLVKTYPWMNRKEAADLADDIINGTSNTAQEAFDVTHGGPKPGSHKGRTLNLSEQKDKDGNFIFKDYLEQDVISNVSKAAKSAARYVGNQEFVGNNGTKISQLLKQMEAEGVPQEVVDRIASHMTDYLNAESGNYKRPTSELGRALQNVQKNFMFFVTLTGLPLATFSSIVELALSSRALTKEQIFGKDGSLSAIGREGSVMLYNAMEAVGSTVAGREAKYKESAGTKQLHKLGYYDWDVGAATTTGVTETHEWHNRALSAFFKWTGLQGWTNYTRAIRASIAGDFIMDNAEIVLDYQANKLLNDKEKTNEVREAEDKLRNLGIDITRDLPAMMEILQGKGTPEMERQVGARVREATYNFINDAVVMPGSANRPLIYQDPRFALFTQFQGFMSAFTANHIPRMWGEYIRRGSPQMKYNTFAMMVAMIGLGFVSQYLKDFIKYGRTTPHLDQAQLVQRGIQASGLLGTSERVINQFFPLYEERSGNAAEGLWNFTTGESPTLSKVEQIGQGVASTVGGDLDRAGNKFGKAIAGPLKDPIARTGQWLFNGE